MINIKAGQIWSGTAASLRETDRGNTGQVHSVYRRTCNFFIDGRLTALAVDGMEPSPDMIITGWTQDFHKTGLTVGMPVYKKECGISLGENIFLDLTDCTEFSLDFDTEPTLLWEREKDYRSCRDTLFRLVKIYGKSSPLYEAFFDKKSSDCMTAWFSRLFKELKEPVAEGNIYGVIRKSVALSGLGIGLTPSGDDFLAGLFLTLALSGTDKKELKNVADECSRRTNQISGQMIANGAVGFGRLSEMELIQAFFERDKEAVKNSVHRVLAFGSSSGTDTALGILTAIDLILNKRFACGIPHKCFSE
ncbi:MAG: DUF2877 domain-containing protein [Lachnospiraceae bacterium]